MPYKSVEQTGFTVYGKRTINSIVLHATQEIDGVAGLYAKGCRTEFNGLKVDVDVFINVFDGVKCSEVAYRIQENIKRNVETMTSYKVGVINVNIFGVQIRAKEFEGGSD